MRDIVISFSLSFFCLIVVSISLACGLEELSSRIDKLESKSKAKTEAESK